jgi:hypothetical protein
MTGAPPTMKMGVNLEAGKTTDIGSLTVENPSPGAPP